MWKPSQLPNTFEDTNKRKEKKLYLLDQNRRQLNKLSYLPKGIYEDNMI